MIINNESNRTNLEVSVEEALELIGELSKAVSAAVQYPWQRTTNGMPASERLKIGSFKPSSFNVMVAQTKVPRG